jgi:hypothetical protein
MIQLKRFPVHSSEEDGTPKIPKLAKSPFSDKSQESAQVRIKLKNVEQ